VAQADPAAGKRPIVRPIVPQTDPQAAALIPPRGLLTVPRGGRT
jgi:hypothetical protein